MSLDRIEQIRNTRNGETAFIVCSGPSLRGADLSWLRDRLVITLNGATLLQEQFGFKPQYYVLTDERFLLDPDTRDMATDRLDADTSRFARDKLRGLDTREFRDRTTYVKTLGRDGFSTDLSAGFYFGATTVMLGVQLAFHLGVKRVALLGADFNYFGATRRFYNEKNPQPIDSLLSVQLWNLANAARMFEAHGRELLVCSSRSFLRTYVRYHPAPEILGISRENAQLQDHSIGSQQVVPSTIRQRDGAVA